MDYYTPYFMNDAWMVLNKMLKNDDPGVQIDPAHEVTCFM